MPSCAIVLSWLSLKVSLDHELVIYWVVFMAFLRNNVFFNSYINYPVVWAAELILVRIA